MNVAIRETRVTSAGKSYLPALGGILAAFALFAAIVFLPIPGWIGTSTRYGFGFWLFALGLLLYLAYRSGRTWMAGILVLLFCALSLSGLWANAANELQVLGGYLYFSDASQYHADALRLLEGFPVSIFSARHPLPTLLLGILLRLMDGNLQLALIILAVVVSLCIATLGNSVARLAGPAAAALLVAGLLLFYRRFIGLPNGEQLGLALGCLSLSFLLRAAAEKNAADGLSGLLFLGLGVAARPGAFLILIFALIWITRNVPVFPRKRIASLCLGLAAVSLGFVLTFLGNFILAEKGSLAFSNYAYSLYGVVTGNRGWEQFATDHPDALTLPSPQAEWIALREVSRAVQADPMSGLRGWIGSYLGYFTTGPASLFGFLSGGETASRGSPEAESLKWAYVLTRLLMYSLAIRGMWSLWRRSSHSIHSLLFWSGVATLLGLSFFPARDAGMMRIHAVSIPFLLCLPSLGLSSLSSEVHAGDIPPASRNLRALLAYGLLSLVLASLPLFSAFTQRQGYSASRCDPDQVPVITRINRGGYIVIVGDDQTVAAGSPFLRYSDFLQRVGSFHRADLLADLSQIPLRSRLSAFVDLRTGQSGWLILPLSATPAPGEVVNVCGTWHPSLLAKGLGFFRAERVDPTTIQ